MRKLSLSDLDLITRKVSILLNIPEQDVEKVMSFEKKSAREATGKFKSVEISGLCTLVIREKKVEAELKNRYNYLAKYESDLEKAETEEEKSKLEKKIETVKSDIEYLKTKQ